jgi:large subunit ribosomal protein L22
MADSDTYVAPTQARASVRYLHVSPYKVRPVLDLVRGLAAEDAERILQLTDRSAAGDVLKLLESALANAENNNQLPADELFVAECYCNEGPTRPAGRARARGRSFRIRKRTSHITIILERYAEDELEVRRRKAEASGAAGRGSSQRRRAERVRASRRPADAHDHDHDHDHDYDHDHDEETVEETTDIRAEDVTEVPADEHDVDIESGEAVEAAADADDEENESN